MTRFTFAFACLLGLALAAPAFAQAQCRSGFVWREAFDGDTVCVPPATRAQAWQDNADGKSRVQPGIGPYGDATCLPGFVWRNARDGDVVCVTPETRDQVAEDNRLTSSRVASVGGSVGSQMGGVGVGVGARAQELGGVVRQTRDLPTQGTPTQAPADSRERSLCQQYASGAVADFRLAQRRAQCRIGPDGRWHDNQRAHFDWCMRVSQQEQRSEYSQRDRHLVNCGARFTY